jgi:cell division protein FtsW
VRCGVFVTFTLFLYIEISGFSQQGISAVRTARNILIGVVLMLVAFGVIMLFSTSIETATVKLDKPYFFLIRQGISLAISAVASLIVLKFDYQWLRKLAYIYWGIVSFLLILAITPGIGAPIKGSWRWLRVGQLTFQPSEFAKLAIIILLAFWYDKHRRKCSAFKRGLLYPGLFLGITLVLIFLEPDVGTTLLIASVGLIMMLMAGAPMKYVAPFALVGLLIVAVYVRLNPERWGRVVAFQDVGAHVQGEGWQLAN